MGSSDLFALGGGSCRSFGPVEGLKPVRAALHQNSGYVVAVVKPTAPLVGGGRRRRQSATVALCQRRMLPHYGLVSFILVVDYRASFR